MSSSRQRKCKNRNKKTKPSAAYYIGYVDDYETPEMIMKKFEELEKLEQQLKQQQQQQQNQQQKEEEEEPSSKSQTESPQESALLLTEKAREEQEEEKETHKVHKVTSTGKVSTENEILTESMSEELIRRTLSTTVQHMLGLKPDGPSSSAGPHGSTTFTAPWSNQTQQGTFYDNYGYWDGMDAYEEEESDESDCDDADYKDNEQEFVEDHHLPELDSLIERHLMPDLQDMSVEMQRRIHRTDPYHNPLEDTDNASLQELYSMLNFTQRQYSVGKQLRQEDEAPDIEKIKQPAVIPQSMAKIIVPLMQYKTYRSGNAQVHVFDKDIPIQVEDDTSSTHDEMENSDKDDADENSTISIPPCRLVEAESVLQFDYRSLGSQYEAILIDPPYEQMKPDDLRELPLHHEWLFPGGYLFVWVEKEFIPDIVDIAQDCWNCEYVENMIWVKQSIDNRCYLGDSPLFAKSKIHLFIFRSENERTRQLQIKHQRNADVYMDFVSDLYPDAKPTHYAYKIVETLLPTSVREGKCLELFGNERDAPRRGWTKIINGFTEP